MEDQRRGVVRHEPLRARVVVSGQRDRTLLCGDGAGEKDAKDERQATPLGEEHVSIIQKLRHIEPSGHKTIDQRPTVVTKARNHEGFETLSTAPPSARF